MEEKNKEFIPFQRSLTPFYKFLLLDFDWLNESIFSLGSGMSRSQTLGISLSLLLVGQICVGWHMADQIEAPLLPMGFIPRTYPTVALGTCANEP